MYISAGNGLQSRVYICIYTYTYTHIHIHTQTYVFICKFREAPQQWSGQRTHTQSSFWRQEAPRFPKSVIRSLNFYARGVCVCVCVSVCVSVSLCVSVCVQREREKTVPFKILSFKKSHIKRKNVFYILVFNFSNLIIIFSNVKLFKYFYIRYLFYFREYVKNH
jgi:hypothetical protein